MKIKSIRLVNFIAIFACRNLKEVFYDFTNTDKTINQICGPNGSGKTVLIQQLHPFSSINLSGDERSDLQLIIPGEIGCKEMVYEVDGKDYIITHTYKPSGKTHSVTSSLMCDGVELNVSNGVNTFNMLIEKIFGLNRYTFQFTINGTQLNSFSNLNSTQRKGLINKALGVDIYDKLYKMATADHRYASKTVTSLLNTREFILKKYGTYENLQSQLVTLKQRAETIKADMDAIKSNIDKTQGSIDVLSASDPYKELTRLTHIIEMINNVTTEIGSYDDKTYAKLSDEHILLTQRLEQNKSEYAILTNDQDNYSSKLDDIESAMAKAKRVRDDYEEMCNVANTLKHKIDMTNNSMNVSMKPDYYMSKLTLAQTINSIAMEIHSTLNNTLLEMLTNMIVEHIDIPSFLIRENSVLNDGEKERNAMERLSSVLSTVNGEFPNECVVDCIYKNTYDRLQVYLKSYQTTSSSKFTQSDLESLEHAWRNISSIIKLIAGEYPPELQNLFSLETIILRIKSTKWGIDIEKIKALYEASVAKETRIELIKQLEDVNKNIEMVKSIMIDPDNQDKAISDLKSKISDINNKRSTLLMEQNQIRVQIEDVIRKKDMVSVLNGVNIGMVQTQINTVNKNIEKLDKCRNDITVLNQQYQSLSMELNSINMELNTITSDDLQCRQTTNELDFNRDKDNKYKMISEATSPTKGLPVQMIKDKLTEAVKIANYLLKIIYDGDVMIKNDDIDISETSFNIPFVHNLVQSVDIRYGSQSEATILSLVLSLALAAKLTNYNILLIDEIDAYLDHEFKDKFIIMLDEVSRILKIDQLFIISHNIDTDQFAHIINRISLV